MNKTRATSRPMTGGRLVRASVFHHWRSSAALALGVAVGTAVLTGALLVGDSVRGSLRRLAVERLGRIADVLVVDRFFRPELAVELAAHSDFKQHFQSALPAILLEATLEAADGGRRANQATVLGFEGDWSPLGAGGPPGALAPGSIVLNEPLAEEIGVRAGDEVILRLPAPSDIPRDTPLGRKTETIRNRRLEVAAVIPAAGLGGFGLRPNQQAPRTAFVAPETIQAALEQPHKVNSILVTTRDADAAPSEAGDRLLQKLLLPELADYGLALQKTPHGYFNLTSQRMLLEDAVAQAVQAEFSSAQLALTYLANTIAAGDREIAYSTVTAVDPVVEPPLGPLRTADGKTIDHLADDEILLNAWAAEKLRVQPGDAIRLTYFQPESAHGAIEEASIMLRLAAVVALEAAAADPHWTPEVKGITDEQSIADWDPPFPFDPRRVTSDDEAYWDQYRATPKAFVSLATGRRLWGSRFGDTTSVRVAPADGQATVEEIASRLQLDPRSLGFAFRPVKRLGLEAAHGTTPFNMLFLGFSLFIILAALLLVALLFRLAIEARAAEIGLLYAVGLSAARVRRAWLGEGMLLAAVGGVAGLALGVGYAELMLTGLNTWWVEAIGSPFVRLHVTATSLAEGYLGGVLTCWLTIAWSLRRLRRADARRLLAGDVRGAATAAPAARWVAWLGWGAMALAIPLAVLGSGLSAEVQAGAFLGCGALVLCGLLLHLWNGLRRASFGGTFGDATPTLARLTLLAGARNPTRSALTIGLVGAAAFLIVSIGAFRASPPAEGDRHGGTGGFALVGESNQPIYENLSEPSELPASTADQKLIGGASIIAIRVRPGDDASCLNLYQPQQPRVLGVPRRFIERGGFAWSGSLASTPAEEANPWLLLEKDYGATAEGQPIMPVVLDAATAEYSLHLGGRSHPGGLGAMYWLPFAKAPHGLVPCLVVGLLANSILQGDLVTSEASLLRHFPETSGYRFFAIDAPREHRAEIEAALERALGDYGFDARGAEARLAGFLVVQNTYLSTFQSLGGLGLLLGTLGLAVVELRNVLERRGELALLRAVGFRHRLLAALVGGENVMLLLAGLSIGLASAAVAVSPHLIRGQAGMPWSGLGLMIGLVVLSGLLTTWIAVRAALAAPLVAALRGA